MFTVDMPLGSPIIAEGLEGHQLGGRVCQAGPRAALRGGYGMAMKLLVEGCAFRQDGVDDGREILRNQRSRNRLALSPLPALEFGFDLGEVFNGADRGVVKRDLEIAIAVARPLVMRLAARVVRPCYQTTIRVEVADGRKARDIVDLQQQGVRRPSCQCRGPRPSVAPQAWRARDRGARGRGGESAF